MFRYLQILIAGILTSFYLFPFPIPGLAGINGKLIMAVIGLLMVGSRLARQGKQRLRRDLFIVTLFALGVSVISVVAVIYNETQQFGDYSIYFISMWVWLSAAYMLLAILRHIHGAISIELIGRYLICICVAQCILAYTNEQIPAVHELLNTIQPDPFVEEMGRWRGLGAALDSAGIRFSATLVILAYIVINENTTSKKWQLFYVVSLFIIGSIGNIISRTTTVGLLMALGYIAIGTIRSQSNQKQQLLSFWRSLILVAIIFIPLIVWVYQTNADMRGFIRYGFEGFFAIAETGRWQVDSNDVLMSMIVFPEDTKTWIIGEGYLIDPTGIEPYYIGPDWHAWYRDTDIGYLRFLFYFGLCGVIAISLFILNTGIMCIRRLPHHTRLFIVLIILNFVCWLKVSTDIFQIFAIFLCFSQADIEHDTNTQLIQN